MSAAASRLHRGLSRFALLVLALLAVALGVGGYWYFGPYQGFATEKFIEIEHGMSTSSIAHELARDGIVRAPWVFLAVRLLHPSARLQAGEYRFGSPSTPAQVFNKIRRGDIFYEEITIPEGSNIFDIAKILAGMDVVRPQDFLTAAGNAELIRDLDPQAPDLEGYLFPSTYRVTHKTTARQLCRLLTDEFRRQWALLPGATTADVHHVVTLASLVEKESAVPAERPLIAGVFLNRLKVGMPLQCDATTVYASELQNRYHGVIHRSDLESANPYNTYAHPGLPPGPIANPGNQALKAALNPASTTFMYFVARPDHSGSHQFSATLQEHEKAVLAYRNGGR